jgi:hypothetical protein
MQKASLVKGSITPKWMVKQGGVAFGFGSKLARFTSNNQTDVDVIPFSSDRQVVSQFDQFNSNLTQKRTLKPQSVNISVKVKMNLSNSNGKL